jgi:hypothetical protein
VVITVLNSYSGERRKEERSGEEERNGEIKSDM